MRKLIVILGPTASGKSSLAISLAQKFSGEIISADSRQVYKGMDLGTGKVPKDKKLRIKDYGLKNKKNNSRYAIRNSEYYSGGIAHHLLDVVLPKKQFTVADFKRRTIIAYATIISKGKLPFLVGGTPFYIYSVIDDLQIPEVKPNDLLRNMLRNKSAAQLFAMLKKLDPRRANNIDAKNPRRLIRAIEIVKATGNPVPPPPSLPHQGGGINFPPPRGEGLREGGNVLILGIKKSQNKLYQLIDKRLQQRLEAGMVNEVKKLLKSKVTHKRLQEMGLEYRFVSLYLQRHLTYDQMVALLKTAIHKFSKRQMTWFKRDKRIQWVKTQKQAEKLIRSYLSSF